MRFTAPPHTTSVHLTIGPVDVEDGILEVPDEGLTPGDLNGLHAHGFVIEPVAAEEPVEEDLPVEEQPEAAPLTVEKPTRSRGKAEEPPVEVVSEQAPATDA